MPVLVIAFQVLSAVVPIVFLIAYARSGNLADPNIFPFAVGFVCAIVCCAVTIVLVATSLRRSEWPAGARFWLLVACIVVPLLLYVFIFSEAVWLYTQYTWVVSEYDGWRDLGQTVGLFAIALTAPGLLLEVASLVMAVVLRRKLKDA